MRATPVILLTLIVCLPLTLLVWLGSRMASDEQTVIEQRFRGLLSAQLRDIDQITVGHFSATQRELRSVAALSAFDAASLRAILRDSPLVRQILVYSPEGDILHPNPGGTLNAGEEEFLLQAADLITDRDLFYAAGGKRRSARPAVTSQNETPNQSASTHQGDSPERSAARQQAEPKPDAPATGGTQARSPSQPAAKSTFPT